MRSLLAAALLLLITLDPSPTLANGPEATVALVGDILLTDAVLAGRGAAYPWAKVSAALQQADLALGNLETAVSVRGQPVPDKQFTFRSRPAALAGAVGAGVDVLSLANNHSRDYGPAALMDTLGHLTAAGIHPVGAGQDAADALRPVLLEAGGLKIAVLAFSRVIPEPGWVAAVEHPGVAAGWEPEPVLAAIRAARARADAVIVLMHWGEEMDQFPRATDAALAEQMTAAGATVVAGHHPHVLQGIRWHGSSLTAFSLGNFIFTSSSHPEARQTGILLVTLGKEGVRRARFLPHVITAGQPRPQDQAAILARLRQLSRPWATRITSAGLLPAPPRPFPPE